VAFRKFRELSGRKKREFEKQLRRLKVARQKCIESMAKNTRTSASCRKKYCRSSKEKARRIFNGSSKG
jgi:predicted nuclease of restriction endonuclease-like RecB superfamily